MGFIWAFVYKWPWSMKHVYHPQEVPEEHT